MNSFSRALLAVAVVAMFGCGDDEAPPTAPTPLPPVTNNFTGTLTRNGAATHNFTATTAGVLTATLTSLSPNTELVVGFGVGTWNGTVCNVVLARDRAVQSTVIYANVNASGDLCVRIYDVATITEPTDYTIDVSFQPS